MLYKSTSDHAGYQESDRKPPQYEKVIISAGTLNLRFCGQWRGGGVGYGSGSGQKAP